MAYSRISLTVAGALALAAIACGGSDQSNPPPQTPSDLTTTTSSNYGNNSLTAGNPQSAANNQVPSDVSNTPSQMSPNTAAGPMPGGTETSTNGTVTGMTSNSGVAAATSGATGNDTSSAATLTDAQITGVTEAANGGEIEQAREALKKAKNAKVKQFAQHMVTDHTDMQTKGKQLAKKAGITPQDSDVSNQLKSGGVQIMTQLRSSTGNDFDKAYIDAQVNEHQQVLDLLDNKMIPQAQNAELKSELQKARDKVADHLKTAKDIQASLNK